MEIAIKKKYHRPKKSQNASRNETKTSKKITKKNKITLADCKRIYIKCDSILKHVQGYEIPKSLGTYVNSFIRC